MGSGGFMRGRTTGGKGDYCMGNCTGVECSGEEVVMIDIVDTIKRLNLVNLVGCR